MVRAVTEDDTGLKVLYEPSANDGSTTTPADAIDIVAIHGIGAHPDDTWCKNVGTDKEGRPRYVNWLADAEMLPSIVPDARIMRYGYESWWFGADAIRQKASTVAGVIEGEDGMVRGAEEEDGEEQDGKEDDGEEAHQEEAQGSNYPDEDSHEDAELEDSSDDQHGRNSLCSICQRLNVCQKSFVFNERQIESGWGSHYLGTLEEIRHRPSCPICSLVAKAIEEYPSSTGKEGDFRLEWGSDRICNQGNKGFQPSSMLYIYRGRSILFESTFKAKGHIALLADGSFSARKISDTIDMNRVQGWLKNCADWHGEECNKPLFEELGAPSELKSFRVVDVLEGRLTKLPLGARYLALSYCWGAVQSLVTVRANVHALETPQGIFQASQELASVIKEAMALTAELAERYLWVDQLCIVQDESETKMESINNMDGIYGHAHLVIIAASGSNANSGLPGFNGRPRGISQATAEIEPGLEVALLPYPVDMIQGCWYSSRGWTYQEQALSKRSLMFIGGQVIFKCRCALWREDRRADQADHLSKHDQDFHEFQTSFEIGMNPLPERYRDSFSSPWELDDDKEEVPNRGPITASLYERAIGEISRRSLTYQTDALNVAAAILRIIEAKDKTGTYFGVPEAYFDSVLLWLPGHKHLNRRSGFPSWSWTGWIGPIGPCMTPQPTTWIVWHICTADGSVTRLETENVRAMSRATVLYRSPSERAKDYFAMFDINFLPAAELEGETPSASDFKPRQGVLRFWTITCKLEITAQVEIKDFRLAGDKSKAFKPPIVDLTDSRGNFAGRMVLHILGTPFTWVTEFIVHSLSPGCEPISDESPFYLGFHHYDGDKELGLGTYALRVHQNHGSIEEEVEDEGSSSLYDHEPASDPPGVEVPPSEPVTAGTDVRETPEAQSEDVDEEVEDEFTEESIEDYAARAYPSLRERKHWRFFNVIAIQRHDDGVAERIGVGKILESAITDSLDGGPVWSEVLLG